MTKGIRTKGQTMEFVLYTSIRKNINNIDKKNYKTNESKEELNIVYM
jgi:hypothetical protein